MSTPDKAPQPSGANWVTWAQRLVAYLARIRSQLRFKITGESAANDGIMLWDPANGYPVVSKSGKWRQVVLEDGHANLAITTDQTAASANTAYSLSYSGTTYEGISVSGDEITFAEAGEYMLCFSAQIKSSSSSTVNFWFWPRINDVDVEGSTMVNALHQNNATLVVSRAAIFNMSAGDVLKVMWAVDSTNGTLDAVAATAFAPAAPATTLAISRVSG